MSLFIVRSQWLPWMQNLNNLKQFHTSSKAIPCPFHSLCICLSVCLWSFVRLCRLITLIKLTQRSQVSEITLCRCCHMYLSLSPRLSLYLSSFFVRSCRLITLIKCLKGHKSLGSLFHCVFKKVCQWVTRSPDELSAAGVFILRYLGKNLLRKKSLF